MRIEQPYRELLKKKVVDNLHRGFSDPNVPLLLLF